MRDPSNLMSSANIVEVDGLRIVASSDGTPLVDGLSFSLPRGGSVGLVGESGSGKSLTALAIIGLLPAGLAASGRVNVVGKNVVGMTKAELRTMRGSEVGMVFQDPFTALNPVFTIQAQMFAVLRGHAKSSLSRTELRRRATDALLDVGLRDPKAILEKYSFQLSGGQAQRVAIAMALIPEPLLLIADEPTTALDVTVQDRILQLLEGLRAKRDFSLLFISHDLAVVARMCEQLCIVKDGQVVESGETTRIIADPKAAYTRLLLESVVDFSALREE